MEKRIEPWTVREIMSVAPITVRPETGIDGLKRLFETHDFNAFPVVDGRGVLQGIVTKLDLLRMFRPTRYRWLPELRPLAGERVADIMTREIVGVGPGDPVAVAVDLMIAYQLRSLPVLERREGRPALVGIVSRTDVLRCLILEACGAEAG